MDRRGDVQALRTAMQYYVAGLLLFLVGSIEVTLGGASRRLWVVAVAGLALIVYSLLLLRLLAPDGTTRRIFTVAIVLGSSLVLLEAVLGVGRHAAAVPTRWLDESSLLVAILGVYAFALAMERTANGLALDDVASSWGRTAWFVLVFPPLALSAYLLTVLAPYLATGVLRWSWNSQFVFVLLALLLVPVLHLVVSTYRTLRSTRGAPPVAAEPPAPEVSF